MATLSGWHQWSGAHRSPSGPPSGADRRTQGRSHWMVGSEPRGPASWPVAPAVGRAGACCRWRILL